jgi:outer membrane lipoprotein carrier protein
MLSVIRCPLYVKKIIISCFSFLILLSTSAFAADVDETVGAIQKKFGLINDIKGTFSQSSYLKDLEQTQKYSGTFFIKKPSMTMWEYAKPRDEKIIIRDTDTWIYKKSRNQVIRTKSSKESYNQTPIAFLGSMEKLMDDFSITMPEKNALTLMPKRKMGLIKMLVLEIMPGEFPVKMFTVFDTYGNIIMIELTDLEINPGLDDSLFMFKIPPGAEVFDYSQ